jgi:endonuclease YncB( thermonuclease family)
MDRMATGIAALVFPSRQASADIPVGTVSHSRYRITRPFRTHTGRGRISLHASTLALGLAFSAAYADFSGNVVSVHDGDTLTILVDRRQVEVRLVDIDAPELKQPFGSQSLRSLADLCLDKEAVVREAGRDRYGHTLGRVVCSGTDANTEQVRRGMAWVYQRRPDTTSPLYFYEDEAQRNHEGLWRDKSPVPPWIWRRGRRLR